jgi:hypothetical protein
MREGEPLPSLARLFVTAPRAHRVMHGRPAVANGGTHVGAPGARKALCGRPTLNWATLWHLPLSDHAALDVVECSECVRLARELVPPGGRLSENP